MLPAHSLPAYYNAGSAALVLILISLAIAVFLWLRMRRNRVALSTGGGGRAEEEIPLRSGMGGYDDNVPDEEQFRKRKGKERALDEPEGEAIFNVGDSDDEDEYKSPDNRTRS